MPYMTAKQGIFADMDAGEEENGAAVQIHNTAKRPVEQHGDGTGIDGGDRKGGDAKKAKTAVR